MTASQHDITSPTNLDRRRRGQTVLAQIDGDQGGDVIASLADINPAMGHHIAAFAFGDVYDRPGLDARSRQLVTLGALNGDWPVGTWSPHSMQETQPSTSVPSRAAWRRRT